MIVADDARRDGTAIIGHDLGGIGFDHEIANRKHEPVAVDQDA